MTMLATAVTLFSVSVAGVPAAHAAPSGVATGVVGSVRMVSGSSDKDVFEAEVLRLTNEARSHSRKCGGTWKKAVGPVRWSPTLANSANAHSADMATKDYFSHYSKSGKSPFQRMRAAGYRYRAAGENIAAGRSLASPEAVVKAWLKSPGHCKVIMNGKYKELGVGRVEGPGRWSVYWTQNFGRRK
jgi:uncharacterized protein YkwD